MDANFFRTFQLNKKYDCEVSAYFNHLVWPSFEDSCAHCKTERTFSIETAIYLGGWIEQNAERLPLTGLSAVAAVYRCAACTLEINAGRLNAQLAAAKRTFLLEFGPAVKVGASSHSRVQWVRKLGQLPAWSHRLSKEEELAIGDYAEHVRAGSACERESFAIGACAYYRRAVEDLLRELMKVRSGQLEGQEKVDFDDQVKVLDVSWSGREAAKLALPALPPSARPHPGSNPLAWMYEQLSGALHGGTQAEAAATAEAVRPILIATLLEIRKERESMVHADRLKAAMEASKRK